MKRARKLLLAAFVVLFLHQAAAQRTCGTMDYLQTQILRDSTIVQNMTEIEQFTQQWVGVYPSGSNARSVYTIPVVVHVVYNTASENISNEQILSQIAVLNEDFRRLNADANATVPQFQGVAADCEIQFCLATLDPNGNSTSGITRTYTSISSFYADDKVKYSSQGGRDGWVSSRYLNLWVCDLSGIIGYAQFPGGQAATDGVVIDYQALGRTGMATFPFNLGRTATHEIGHWLNLRHIWGDGGCGIDDGVNDTPDHSAANYGCPLTQTSCNALNMVQNFMDYTNDACMNLFTAGQKARIQALFAPGGYRYSLLASNGCNSSNTTPTCIIPTGLNVTNIQTTSAKLNWIAVNGATNYSVRIKAVSSSVWSYLTTTATYYNKTGLIAGTQYEFQVKTICSTVSTNYSSSAYFATASTTTSCVTPSGLNVSGIQTTSATLNWSTVNGASSYSGRIKPFASLTWISFSQTGNSYNANALLQGTQYEFQVKAICGTTSSDYSSSVIFTTAAAVAVTSCTDTYEPNQTLSANKSISPGTTVRAMINNSTDADWFRFGTQSTKRNIKITLNNLPADFNVALYDSRGVKVGQSINTGTANETIIYNNGYLGTYYLKVFGSNGAFSSQCYELMAQLSSSMFRTNKAIFRMGDERMESIKVYPNPANRVLTVSFFSETEGEAVISILDVAGKVVHSNKTYIGNGKNTLTIQTENLSEGIYLLNYQSREDTETRLFLIQR